MRGKVIRWSLVLLLCGAVVSSCSKKEEGLKVNQDFSARVLGRKISDKEVDERFNQLTPAQQKDYKGREGRANFVDRLIDEEMLYVEAKNLNLHRDKKVMEELRLAEKTVLIGAYYNNVITKSIEISDKEAEQYYENHLDTYSRPAILKAQHIFSQDSLKCVRWKRRIESGENFDKIAKEESEDKTTSPNSGDLGFFNIPGFINFVGTSERFGDQIKDLEAGEISDVVDFEKGYSIVKVNRKQPASVLPFEDAKPEIVNLLQSRKSQDNLKSKLQELKNKFKPENYVREKIISATRSPEELWEIAQAEDAAYTRIQYYRNLVNRYPDHQYAAQALFMIGFVYAEELQDLVSARRTFDELLNKYPNSEVVESARWMIDNLYKSHPKFESVDDMKQMMDDEDKE
ncbi:MAG: peptidyl-prolyl cis-trans isomerase [Candidatus Krumholzibacteriota bacterium]|nr:peptidyl-prolyl cis-trans isomerase [Candidatus Krumholzibacteriota bacterium]